ncbi:MAG: C-GCAxxG-C-C family protein [Candidatus Thorarchaeota archaeon]|jgi:C_GCAxxG_C_C family probable redox protein
MPSNSADTANKIFREQKAHCAQAIFAAYSEQLDEGKVDFDTGMKIAAAFSGGISRTGNVCGALTGALMAIGLKYSTAEKADEIAGYLLKEFKSLNGTIICRELINHDLLTDEDIKQAFAKGSFDNCPKFVDDVTKILDKLLALHLSD